MQPESIIPLLLRTLPYPEQITHIEMEKQAVRFTWRSQRFRVSTSLFVESIGAGVLVSDDISAILGALLKQATGAHAPSMEVVQTCFTALLSRIARQVDEAMQAGMQPDELWLGPTEASIILAEMKRQAAEGRLLPTDVNFQAVVQNDNDVEGVVLFGLRVRCMVRDGVQVGISWPRHRTEEPATGTSTP